MYPLTQHGEPTGLGANDIPRNARSRTKPLLFALRPPQYAQLRVLTKKKPPMCTS